MLVTQRGDEQRAAPGLTGQGHQRVLVHVVVVVVRQQHHVDVWQLIQAQAWWRLALWAGPLHRKAARREHRVG